MNRPECACFENNPRLQAICNGTAHLSLNKINAYRAKWGLSPLTEDEYHPPHPPTVPAISPSRDMQHRLARAAALHVANSGPSVFVASAVAPETGSARSSCCGGGATAAKPPALIAGPGTELVRIWTDQGYPECDACRRLASQMNQWGASNCRKHMEAIVEDVLPRAKQWLAEERPWMLWAAQLADQVGLIDAEEQIRGRIRQDVIKAIETVEARRPRRATPSNGPISTAMQQTPTDHSWRTDPQIVAIGKDLLSRTAIIVKSFQRHDALLRFIRSVRKFYPNLPIHVADDSFTHGEPQSNSLVNEVKGIAGVHWLQMPYDSGLPAGRNLAVQAATGSEFIVVCDDDFIFEEKTDLTALLLPLDQCGLDLCGGPVRMNGHRAESWIGMFHFRGTQHDRQLVMERPTWKVETCHGIRFQRVDVTHNFFAARRQVLLDHPWDERYKISAEHLDSFLTWHQAAKSVALSIDCVVSHEHGGSKSYQIKRKRQFHDLLLKKWNISKRLTIGMTYFPEV